MEGPPLTNLNRIKAPTFSQTFIMQVLKKILKNFIGLKKHLTTTFKCYVKNNFIFKRFLSMYLN